MNRNNSYRDKISEEGTMNSLKNRGASDKEAILNIRPLRRIIETSQHTNDFKEDLRSEQKVC